MKTEEFLSIIKEEATIVATTFGISAGTAAAESLADRIRLRLGGLNVYIPKKCRLPKDQIKAQFTGNNIAALAQEHDRTERRIRQIVGIE